MRRGVLLLLAASCGRLEFRVQPDAAGDGASDAADAPIELDAGRPPCGTTVVFDDGFDDGVAGPAFAALPQVGLTIAETGSEMTVTFGTVAAAHYAAYRSVSTYAVEGLCFSVEVTGIPDPTNTDVASYMKIEGATQQIEMFEYGGKVEPRTQLNGTVDGPEGFAWDPIVTRFWRVGQAGGIAYWETSPDGITYQLRYAEPFAIAGEVKVELGAGAIQDSTSTAAARFGSARLTN